jgi:hypothetical protein
MKVLLGAWLGAEAEHPGCPWGGNHGEDLLERNRDENQAELWRLVRRGIPQPITYPVWEFRTIERALDYTVHNWRSVAERHPGKTVVITEAGWTTQSSGRGIRPDNASPALQAIYLEQLTGWSREAGVLTFVFEAFDENWKGGPRPDEVEKHWGLFRADRTPKQAVRPAAAPAGP